MPDCSVSFDSEIEEGLNKRVVKCKYCSSVILTPSSAAFVTFEYELPLIKQTKGDEVNPKRESISLFWEVKDIFTFQNVGFSNTVGDTKYLTCADCESGPIGYHDIQSKMSYVALSRVAYENPL